MKEDAPAHAPNVSLAKLFGVFLYVGGTSFGGSVIAYLRDHLVSRQEWLDEDQFLAAAEIGQTVPGLISTNAAVIVGGHLRGAAGAIAAAVGSGIDLVLDGRVASSQEACRRRDPPL